MTRLIKPKHLNPGDTVALVSPSSGLAGESFISYRVELAKARLEEIFGLNIKIMKHALDGIDALYHHPKHRAADIHEALLDKEVKAIFSFIGGEESMRIVPYLDDNIIKQNPKIFMGYSDITSIHLKFYQAGIMTYYGPAILSDFAEHVEMDSYTIDSIQKVLFTNHRIGTVKTSPYYRKFGLRWEEVHQNIQREKVKNTSYKVVNGKGKVTGDLIGGCFEVLNNLRGTYVFPDASVFKNKILFVENSETPLPLDFYKQAIRSLADMKVLENVEGILIGKPQNDVNHQEIEALWLKILKEQNLERKIVIANGSFGHNEPKCILPYGVSATLDADKGSFEINESGCS
ncbi:S66 family peptidase [Staphylococcus simulans]|uniref:S66 family peptidase n=1 Tax=Staphylococcus simulans TaxID=1286 RepID=UPI000D1E8489|nr:S66 peptidase family protein [Staphylococcus simulans]MDY5059780.1 LD-carboxypeptidase [Staphylococcus simulans]PTJ19971.1 LD-carboxypeptidase [Staphylococcus simulans]